MKNLWIAPVVLALATASLTATDHPVACGKECPQPGPVKLLPKPPGPTIEAVCPARVRIRHLPPTEVRVEKRMSPPVCFGHIQPPELRFERIDPEQVRIEHRCPPVTNFAKEPTPDVKFGCLHCPDERQGRVTSTKPSLMTKLRRLFHKE